MAGIQHAPASGLERPAAALQPLVDSLREAVVDFSQRTVASSKGATPGAQAAAERPPEETAESFLGAAFAAGEIYERLVQLEATAAPSILLDWLVLKQAATSAARSAMESALALLPSLQDAGTVARIRTGTAEIEAKLSGSR